MDEQEKAETVLAGLDGSKVFEVKDGSKTRQIKLTAEQLKTLEEDVFGDMTGLQLEKISNKNCKICRQKRTMVTTSTLYQRPGFVGQRVRNYTFCLHCGNYVYRG